MYIALKLPTTVQSYLIKYKLGKFPSLVRCYSFYVGPGYQLNRNGLQ